MYILGVKIHPSTNTTKIILIIINEEVQINKGPIGVFGLGAGGFDYIYIYEWLSNSFEQIILLFCG